MAAYTIAFVGTGTEPDEQDRHGFAMAYRHASAFDVLAECELVACADIVVENAEAFAEFFGIDADSVYEDYNAMVDEQKPDIVSVCTPPHAHGEIVVDIVQHGSVEAIHCEKPMERTWEKCERMTDACEAADVQLTFNHQRRFGAPYRRAKELLDQGAVGDLERVECAAPNIYDYGSHSVDLCNYFNDDRYAEWVLGQLDYRDENLFFGAHNENQTIVGWEYENGVHGLASTGDPVWAEGVGAGLVGCHHRLVGSEGVIEIGPGWPEDFVEDDPVLRVNRSGEGIWETVDCDGEGLHGHDTREYGRVYIDRAIEEVVAALDVDERSELDARNALKATEIIFGCWESARCRGRVDLPLDIDDNPLDAMIESGELTPKPRDMERD